MKNNSKTVRLKSDIINAINKIAIEENRSFNNTVETLLLFAIHNRKLKL